jgi:outer membrane receptor protein involved in Fe transport
MRFSVRGVWVALFAILLTAFPLCAQIDNGNITGRVTDQSGAAIAGAQVTVTQTAMNFETVTQSNEEGLYRANQLRPGPYTVAVVAQGFKRTVRQEIDLRMGETLQVNVALEIGAVAESVEVKAEAAMLQTETSATGQVVEGDYFYRLPNFQRNIKGILFFTPGMTYSGLAYTGNMNNMHINGLRYQYIGVFEDGALGTVGDGMTVDSIENTIAEIKVLTTTLPAEYGHSAGGAISVVKKSGTNELHGIASQFGRTRRMQQRKFFDKYQNSQIQPGWTKAPGLISEQPDGNINGPVYIPKIYDGRNKTFFMFAIQRYIEKQSKQQVSTVPTLDELGGDFGFGGIGQSIYDPRSTRQDASGNWLRDIYPNKVIPKNLWSKVAQNVLARNPYLAPNVPGTLTSTGPSQNIMTGPMKNVFWENYSVRLDQQFTSNFKAFGSWTYNSRVERQPPWTIASGSFFDYSLNKAPTYQNTWSAGTTWVVSPTMVNDMRASYYRYDTKTTSIAYQQDYATQLGIAGLPKDCMPGIFPGGFTESIQVGCPSRNIQEIITFKDDLNKAHGAHSFKMGYELLRYRQDQWDMSTPDGSFTYSGTSGLNTNGTNLSNTGNTFANFLTGAINNVSFSRRLNANLPRVWQHSFYAQDDWKILPSLTLNLGLRYNVETPPSQKYGLISVFDPTAKDDSQYTNYTCNNCLGAWTHPQGARAYNWDLTRFDPRVGAAWHPFEKIVVRGGFAMAHVDMRAGYLQTDELMSDSTSIAQANGNPTPLFYLDQGVPAFSYPVHRADGSVPYRGNAGGHGATMVDQNMKAAYTMSWNLGVETELSKNYVLTVEYKGSATVRNGGAYNLNSRPWGLIPSTTGSGYMDLNDPANAAYRNTWLGNTQVSRPWNNWGDINMNGNTGHLTHHEAGVKLEKRFSNGLNFLTYYTFGKTLEGGSSNPYLNWNLTKTRSVYDQTHNFTGTMTYELPMGKGRRFLNKGGLMNLLLGGYDMVWTYTISSGAPLGVSITGSPYSSNQYPGYMPNFGNVLLTKRPSMRSNWQDLGGDRFNQNNENSGLTCGYDGSWVQNWGNSCMVVKQPFSLGNDGGNIFDQQRIIAATFSAGKEIPIKERLHLKLRFDFQNPFKWYNWGAPATPLAVNSASSAKSFGTYTPGNEGTTAAYGGVPLMNVTIALKW